MGIAVACAELNDGCVGSGVGVGIGTGEGRVELEPPQAPIDRQMPKIAIVAIERVVTPFIALLLSVDTLIARA
jgi:hypothetical protein